MQNYQAGSEEAEEIERVIIIELVPSQMSPRAIVLRKKVTQ